MTDFDDLPGLKKAFLEKRADFVILDAHSPSWQWQEVRGAFAKGLVGEDFIEIDEQETQLRYRLTAKGKLIQKEG